MARGIKNLVDEGFRISLVETAFFNGKHEIPHIDAPCEIVIPSGLVPFSKREKSFNLGFEDFVCFYENDIEFRSILTDTEKYVNDLKRFKGVIALYILMRRWLSRLQISTLIGLLDTISNKMEYMSFLIYDGAMKELIPINYLVRKLLF